MARWEGNTRGRLERAALDLFTEQGYDRTTVAQIAKRANLTERSFYRWFSDKREALFGGGEELEEAFLTAIAAVPEGAGPLATLLTAFSTAAEVFRPRAFLRERAAVIAANPPLQERELVKLASLSRTLTAALVDRGHDPATARLATDAAMAVFRRAGERWMTDEDADYTALLAASAADLLTILAEEPTPSPRP
ncbi:TetR/AcrR family transcriptional regulator [Actinacidiphila acidipaludis]|uniref:TetR/AcrR family transcriptional regulator n=1 Tax=Actinacidiphila acidipaludis TaxID=2873382 RepID=A0ABS7Q817_9ACTN|nr:TetR/AcrR family transcriptional regulator [Streptomyces acidipaludis]MBY8878971.1 TetR/AcrR family transcriptional regulator [Streptomyces acidipaludis]